ncbi:hypothetical protein [Thalassotalea montiporae]
MRFLFASVLVIILSFQVTAQFLNIEQRTVKAGVESLQWLQFLHAVSKQCDYYEYAELAPREELSILVKAKLKITLEKLEVWIEENEALNGALYEQLNKVNCEQIEITDFLSNIYDAYDIAKFNLELYEPITQPLLTQGELAKENEQALQDYIASRQSEAETIMLAEIIPFNDVPEDIKHSFQFIKPDYIYRITRGWRAPHRYQYLTIPITFDPLNTDEEYKHIVDTKGKSSVLIFVKNPPASISTHIIGTVNLDIYPVDLSSFQSPDWEWVGRTLVE